MQALAHGAGARGMVLGQELDIAWEGKPATDEVLRRIHRNKTGALINAAVQMGAAAADGTAEQRQALETFAYGLGLVFQIVDDVLDVTSTAEQLGKPIGSVAENGKTHLRNPVWSRRCTAPGTAGQRRGLHRPERLWPPGGIPAPDGRSAAGT